MVKVIRNALALLLVLLSAVVSVGCGPQEKKPVPETPTAEPGTPPGSPTPAQPGAAPENQAAREQQEVSAQMPPEWLPPPQNLENPEAEKQEPKVEISSEWVYEPEIGSASARR